MKRYLIAFSLTFIFALVACFIYLLHIYFFFVDVVFYSAIIDVIIAALIVGTLLFSARPIRGLFTGLERTLLVLIWLVGGYAAAISGPTVLDRSLSFYILEKLQQRGGAIRQEAMERVFVNEYVREHRLVDVRLTEQLESGTIEIANGCVRLTPWGDTLASISRTFRLHLLPKKRQLLGEYSDDLVDPFRSGSQNPQGYECE